jgi:hypothetical protein
MAYRMKQYGVFFVLLESFKQGEPFFPGLLLSL